MKVSVIASASGAVLEQFDGVVNWIAKDGVIIIKGEYSSMIATFVISPQYPIYIREAREEDHAIDVAAQMDKLRGQIEEHLKSTTVESVPDATGNDHAHRHSA